MATTAVGTYRIGVTPERNDPQKTAETTRRTPLPHSLARDGREGDRPHARKVSPSRRVVRADRPRSDADEPVSGRRRRRRTRSSRRGRARC
ncbi:hypothetical protein BN903_25 [Halorubrum sp. AJ67]|nr:hypothetical protein BN903_25 [Halorubrum sp. AJ67]